MDEYVNVTLETTRLVLRTVTLQDAEPVALNWKLYEGPVSQEEAENQINRMIANHRQNQPGKIVHLCLAIIDKASQEWIGWCGLDHLDRAQPNPVLFYLLKAGYWGQGLATEAAGALLHFAFTEMGLPRIDSAAAHDNLASKRVMEKLGMQYLGPDAEGGYAFTLTREAFLQSRA